MAAQGEDMLVELHTLSLNDHSEEVGDIGAGSGSESCPKSNYWNLVERLTCSSVDYVHDCSKLDSVKYAIGESIFIKNSPIVTLYAPILQFPVPKAWSTVAILDRGPAFPPLQAVSGWGHEENSNLSRISGRLWTEQVFLVSKHVGYVLTPDDRRDQGRPGWFNASHAEKQVLAFLLRYHTNFKDQWGKKSSNVTQKCFCAVGALWESKKHEVISLEEHTRACRVVKVRKEEESLRNALEKTQVVPLPKAEVFLNKGKHCEDCEAFFEAVKRIYKLNLVVHLCQMF